MSTQRFEFDRIPFHLVRREKSAFKETYGGAEDVVVCEGQHLKPRGIDSRTVIIFMHPTGIMNLLPMPNELAARGMPVLCCGSRYPHNDTALIMEKVLLDLGGYVRYAREKLRYEKVILGGWSGGGSLSLFYQSQAEHPTIVATPAGDPCDVVSAGLMPADAVLQLAAHLSRALILTEWLDPSILDESDPTRRDRELNLYDPENPNQPPYSAAFVERFRKAQVARSRRIDAWVKEQLAAIRKSNRPNSERCFVVHGTMADPRWLDPAIEPNDRTPRHCYMGDPEAVNMSPAGLARYSSLRSWLSQWSYDDSRATAPGCGPKISVPVLVVENSADDACPTSHARGIYESIKHANKEKKLIKGATHYYLGQPDKLAESVTATLDWLNRRGLASV